MVPNLFFELLLIRCKLDFIQARVFFIFLRGQQGMGQGVEKSNKSGGL
jgi:hypothetical protein